MSLNLRPSFLAAVLAFVAAVAAALVITDRRAEAEAPFSDAETEAIEEIVRAYLIENPDVLLDVLDALETREQAEAEAREREAIDDNLEALTEDPLSYVAGNPDGDVTLIEFFDYQCGYCKRAFPGLMETVRDDGNVRLVLKEFPILGEESVIASRAALAAIPQGKYMALHTALLESKGSLSEEKVFRIAGEAGLDVDRLKRDMDDERIDDAIERSYDLAEAIGVRGTPAFVIAGKLVPGAVPPERLEELIAEARSGCLTC